jgi:hypothetical protein
MYYFLYYLLFIRFAVINHKMWSNIVRVLCVGFAHISFRRFMRVHYQFKHLAVLSAETFKWETVKDSLHEATEEAGQVNK